MVEPEEQPRAPLPVVAVVVTHDAPGERLEPLLGALAGQDHPNLDVLVVDTGTGDVSERVAAVLPAALVHRVDPSTGFGAAANTVLDLVSGAAYYLFCHDDVVPAPQAVSALVEAAEAWEADVLGPKLVTWDEPGRLAQFGAAVDRLGVALPLVERRELDQGQHDGLRDVFSVPGAFTLVRAERFAEVGGFDEAITFLGDDLSLAWRVRIAGGRVLVTSAARVRHAEAFADRPDGRRRRAAGRPPPGAGRAHELQPAQPAGDRAPGRRVLGGRGGRAPSSPAAPAGPGPPWARGCGTSPTSARWWPPAGRWPASARSPTGRSAATRSGASSGRGCGCCGWRATAAPTPGATRRPAAGPRPCRSGATWSSTPPPGRRPPRSSPW